MAAKKNIPELRFKGFEGEWEETKLADIADIVRGASPRPINDPKWFDEKSTVGWLRISDVTEQDGRIYYLQQRISKVAEEKTRVLTEPHLLLSIAASVGKPVVNYVETGVHDGFLIFKNPNFIQEYMYQWMKMFEAKWQKYGQPGSQVNLNSEIVKKQEISIPSLPEQAQIGTYFQNLDSLISLQQSKYNKLLTMKKAMLEKMFPKEGADVPEIRFKGFEGKWEKKKLGEVGFVGMNRRIFKEQTHDSGEVPFYKIGTFGGKPDAYITRILFDEYKSKYPYPKYGDILISASGSIGRTVEYLGADEYFQDSNIVWLEHDETITNIFLKYFYAVVKWEGLEGSTIKRLYNKTILETKIYLPPVDEQIKIGTFFQTLDTLISEQQKQLEKLKNIKKACLEKMFV